VVGRDRVRLLSARAIAVALLACASAAHAAEPLRFETLEGDTVLVSAADADTIVLHFWATWCPPCKEELRVLERAAAACDPGRVRVLAIDVGEDADTVRSFLGDRALALPLLIDPRGKAWRGGGGREMPANWIWRGEERRWSFGPSSEAAWRERLGALGCATAAGSG
jgi:thiol-disulfide isomerase/thioredoxin